MIDKQALMRRMNQRNIQKGQLPVNKINGKNLSEYSAYIFVGVDSNGQIVFHRSEQCPPHFAVYLAEFAKQAQFAQQLSQPQSRVIPAAASDLPPNPHE